jgi:hypothetical protein
MRQQVVRSSGRGRNVHVEEGLNEPLDHLSVKIFPDDDPQDLGLLEGRGEGVVGDDPPLFSKLVLDPGLLNVRVLLLEVVGEPEGDDGQASTRNEAEREKGKAKVSSSINLKGRRWVEKENERTAYRGSRHLHRRRRRASSRWRRNRARHPAVDGHRK